MNTGNNGSGYVLLERQAGVERESEIFLYSTVFTVVQRELTSSEVFLRTLCMSDRFC